MKVLFLDFDGVLNHPGTYAALEEKYFHLVDKTQATGFRESEWLESKLVRRIGELCVNLNLVIAVISTWRHRHSRIALEMILRERGLPISVRVLTCADGCSKGEALQQFLDENPNINEYVIVDDGPGELPDVSRLVKTDGAVGLTNDDCAQIARMFS